MSEAHLKCDFNTAFIHILLTVNNMRFGRTICILLIGEKYQREIVTNDKKL